MGNGTLSVALHVLQTPAEAPSARGKGRVGLGKANPQTSEEGRRQRAPVRKDGLLGGARAHGSAVTGVPRRRPPAGHPLRGCTRQCGICPDAPKSPFPADHAGRGGVASQGASSPTERSVCWLFGRVVSSTQVVSLPVGTFRKGPLPRVSLAWERIRAHTLRAKDTRWPGPLCSPAGPGGPSHVHRGPHRL